MLPLVATGLLAAPWTVAVSPLYVLEACALGWLLRLTPLGRRLEAMPSRLRRHKQQALLQPTAAAARGDAVSPKVRQRLQPYAIEAAAVGHGGCNRMQCRLCVAVCNEAVTVCT